MLIEENEKQEIENILYRYDCEHMPQLKEAVEKVCEYVNSLANPVEQIVGNNKIKISTQAIDPNYFTNIRISVDKSIPKGEIHFIDQLTGDVKAKIINIGKE